MRLGEKESFLKATSIESDSTSYLTLRLPSISLFSSGTACRFYISIYLSIFETSTPSYRKLLPSFDNLIGIFIVKDIYGGDCFVFLSGLNLNAWTTIYVHHLLSSFYRHKSASPFSLCKCSNNHIFIPYFQETCYL